jgi:hypothetical protein
MEAKNIGSKIDNSATKDNGLTAKVSAKIQLKKQ